MGQAARRRAKGPLVPVEINGSVRMVPQGRVEVEQLAARGAKLQAEIDGLTRQRDAGGGADLIRLVAYHQREIDRLCAELDELRAPHGAHIGNRQAELGQVKEALFQAMRPWMGEQRSMRVDCLAGPILVERNPQMKVRSVKILRNLLGKELPDYFEVEETARPLKGAWDLLTKFSGQALDRLLTAISVSDTGRVRFLSDSSR